MCLGAVALFCLWAGHPWSTGLALLTFAGLFGEWVWFFKTHHRHRVGDVIIFLGGLIYLGGAFGFCWNLLQSFEANTIFPTFIYLFALVWTTDISAYFVGKSLGGKRLAPKISPQKTWSGFWGGLVGGSLAGILTVCYFLPVFLPLSLFIFFCFFTLGLGVVAQSGDLLESAVKRYFGAKDTSALIPGHGGLWDRLDSFVAVAFVLFCLEWLKQVVIL